jgi:hypothetical protein
MNKSICAQYDIPIFSNELLSNLLSDVKYRALSNARLCIVERAALSAAM